MLERKRQEPEAPKSTITVTRVSDFKNTLPVLSGPAHARYKAILDHVEGVRTVLGLHDLDTARLFKRFIDEPNDVDRWVQGNILGMMNRHFNRSAGMVIDRRDRYRVEFIATDPYMSPLELEAFERVGKDAITPNDVELLLQPLMSFSGPRWGQAPKAR